MKLYLIRHGQSQANITKTFAGQSQVLLTEIGEAEALRAGTYLKDVVFDKVYTSDLVRAIRTKELALPGISFEKTPLLREYDMGDLVGKRFADCPVLYGERYQTAKETGNYSFFGGESREEVVNRAKEFLDMVCASSDETVAAFSHRGLLLAILSAITDGRIPYNMMRCDNCSINILEYKNGNWQVLLWNYTGAIS